VVETMFITVSEIAKELGVSKPFAYKLVKQMNEDLASGMYFSITL